jgi:hypothetical protein
MTGGKSSFRRPATSIDAATADLPQLLTAATNAGVSFRVSGAEIEVSNPNRLAPDIYAALRNRRGELWDFLGGATLHQPSLDLLAQLGVEAVVPQSAAEAQALLAQIAESGAKQPLIPMHSSH